MLGAGLTLLRVAHMLLSVKVGSLETVFCDWSKPHTYTGGGRRGVPVSTTRSTVVDRLEHPS